MFLHRQQGFTLVEVTITLAIFSILVVIGVALMTNTLGRNQVGNVMTDTVSTLRRAQWQSMNGHEDDVWGVHFETDSMTLFRGSTYSFGASDNVVTDLPNDIEYSSISLNGGGDDVLFDDSFGSTTAFGTLTIEDTNSDESRSVTVNAVGMIDWN